MQDDFDIKKLVTDKKKKTNSRTKGNTFERKVCKLLNTYFQTSDFMRSPGSGAFSNTHNLPDYLKFSGDLITPKNFKYTIECKKGYNKENIGSIFNIKSDIINFIKQAESDARKIQKNFLLIFQQDRKEILCLFNEQQSPILSGYAESKDSLILKILGSKYIICRLEDLLETTKNFNALHLWRS